MAEPPVIDWEGGARDVTRGVLKGIADWFRSLFARDTGSETNRPGRGILVLGPGGTGKTTLVRLLSGRPDWLLDIPWDYTQSLDVERETLSDDPGVELVAPPGQEFRRESSWPELLRDLSAGRYRGVVLTTSYGYHDLAVPSFRDHVLFQKRRDEFLAEYLADRRADELRVLRLLVPHLTASPERTWLLTAVVKQDLWGSDQGAVERHYREGEFGRAVESVALSLGERFRREFAFASLVIANFDTARGERLQPNEAGYDHRRQVASLRRLLETVATLKSWEERS